MKELQHVALCSIPLGVQCHSAMHSAEILQPFQKSINLI